MSSFSLNGKGTRMIVSFLTSFLSWNTCQSILRMWKLNSHSTPEIKRQRNSMRWLTRGETSSQTNAIKECLALWTPFKPTLSNLLPNSECNKVKNIQVNSWLFFPGFKSSSCVSMCLPPRDAGSGIRQPASIVSSTFAAAVIAALRWDPVVGSSQSSHS